MTANLLSRLEGLTAPDREVDLEVHMSLAPDLYPEGSWSWDDKNLPPHLTASLDATVALCERVLPGWSGDIDIGKPIADSGKVGASLFPPGDGWQNYSGVGPTPAIALLIAILTALEARENG